MRWLPKVGVPKKPSLHKPHGIRITSHHGPVYSTTEPGKIAGFFGCGRHFIESVSVVYVVGTKFGHLFFDKKGP